MTTRTKAGLALVAVAAVAVVAGVAWRGSGTEGPPAGGQAERWTCPMHPQIVRDAPGSCPICGMDLVPARRPSTPSTAPAAGGPGLAGQGVVHLDAVRRQLVGVRTAPVELAPFSRTIRAVGRVAYDETRLRHVHTKIDGYVERLFANATGVTVRHGQPLLEIFSPELLASQQEFLIALAARDRMANSEIPSVSGYGHDLVESTRRRLQLFDLTDAQIATLERTRQPRRTVTVYAHGSGVVTARNVTEGERIEAGTNVLDVAELSKVWVLASVYEYELPYVQLGQRATMRLSYLPGRTFTGTVSLVYPALEAATRTAQVRLEFDNPGLLLKPEMYAEVELSADLGERVSVPEAAILETGTRSLAFVEREPGVFEPREVRIGARLSDRYEVLSGLLPGETVVVSGNFLIDSESKLKAALEATAGPADPHAGHAR